MEGEYIVSERWLLLFYVHNLADLVQECFDNKTQTVRIDESSRALNAR